MLKPRIFIFAAVIVALSGVRPASAAQTVANLKIISGDGQAICPCVSATLQAFQPATVQALDSNQQPVPNATLNWTVTTGQISLANIQQPPLKTLTTQTDSNGMSTVPISEVITITSGTDFQPFLQSTIQVTANTGSPAVTLTETVSLVDQHGDSEIQVSQAVVNTSTGFLTLDKINITGNSGSTFFPPFQMFVGGNGLASNGVQGVSMRLVPLQANPTIACAPGASPGDPGTNLSGPIFNINPPLNVACSPVFGGSGSGQFDIVIGGFPSGDPNNNNGPLYLQIVGPYSFTSIPGTPTTVQILQGDGQTLAPAQSLGTLIAKLVDGRGNGVQNVQMQWTANPTGAVTILNAVNTTDNNGEVSAQVAFSGTAAGLVTIKVSQVSNPSVSATFNETATALISSLVKVSGDTQSAPAGSAFAAPLVVQVKGASSPVANYPVQFTVISGVAAVGSATILTDANGNAQEAVTAGNTPGTVTIKATVGNLSQTFTLTVLATGPTPNNITKLSGDAQSAIISTNFSSPLVVQVNSSAGPVANYTVQFSASSNVTLSANSAITNVNGQAQVNVQAGPNTGSATVTANIPGFSVTFNLTISPPGPTLTTSSFLNGASGQAGFLSPCSIATISASGLAPNGAASLFPAPIFGALPTQVNGLSVTFNNVLAPIFSETMGASGQPQVMVQVPCEATPGNSVPVVVNVGAGVGRINIPILAASPGIFETAYSDGARRAVVLRSDGSFATLLNPARRGEIVRIYVTGLGPTIPFVGTNSVDNPGADLLGADAQATGTIVVGITGGGATVIGTRLAANMIGVFEVAVLLPANAPQSNDNVLSVSVLPAGTTGVRFDSLASKIPIQ